MCSCIQIDIRKIRHFSRSDTCNKTPNQGFLFIVTLEILSCIFYDKANTWQTQYWLSKAALKKLYY